MYAAPLGSWNDTTSAKGPRTEYGLTVHLCITHHRDNRKGAHSDAALAKKMHKIGQYAFEQSYPDKRFKDIFGINYLDHGEIPDGFEWQ